MPDSWAKALRADDALVRLNRDAGQVAREAAGGGDLLGGDVGRGAAELTRPRAQRHDHLFQRGVAGALAEPVDRDLDLARARLDAGQGVGRGKAEIVVAVRADDRTATDELDHLPHQPAELLRLGVADGIGHVDDRCARGDGRLEGLEQEADLGARSVLGAELDVVVGSDQSPRLRHAGPDAIEHLGARAAQLVGDVDVAGRDEDVELAPCARARAPPPRSSRPRGRSARARRSPAPRSRRRPRARCASPPRPRRGMPPGSRPR